MPHQDRPIQPAYRVGRETKSILDLLARFADPDCQSHGVSRLSDLHLKVGEPARYRFEDDLVAVPKGDVLTEEVLRRLLFPLLSDGAVARLTGASPQDVDAAFDLPEESLS